MAFGALNVESQCSWAAGTLFGQTLTMSSWLLVVATLQVYVSIGTCVSLGRILTIGIRSVAVGALNVDSQCSWAAVPVFVMTLTMSSRSFVEAKMHVKVRIGSCAIFGEISDDWVASRGGWRSQC